MEWHESADTRLPSQVNRVKLGPLTRRRGGVTPLIQAGIIFKLSSGSTSPCTHAYLKIDFEN